MFNYCSFVCFTVIVHLLLHQIRKKMNACVRFLFKRKIALKERIHKRSTILKPSAIGHFPPSSRTTQTIHVCKSIRGCPCKKPASGWHMASFFFQKIIFHFISKMQLLLKLNAGLGLTAMIKRNKSHRKHSNLLKNSGDNSLV